jgi:small conductance mechanosensitive channel
VAGVVVPFLFKIAGAVALWIVGGWLIGLAMRLLRRSLSGGKLDPTLIKYLLDILSVLLRVVVMVGILGFFGIQTASFAALLAGAGVAIGAAWSGILGNFAAGVFLQIVRPISVGDYVDAGGVEGTVHEIGMIVTSITSIDNVLHYVGNAKLFGDNIKNYSANPHRRVDLLAQLDNSADVPKAIKLLREGIQKVPNLAQGVDADIEVLEFTERGPLLAVRPYTHNDNYWQVYFDTNRMIVDVLGQASSFPVPRIPVAFQGPTPN